MKQIPFRREPFRERPLGSILVKMGFLSQEKVHECLEIQKQRAGNEKIGQIFLELGLIDRIKLEKALAAQQYNGEWYQYCDICGVDKWCVFRCTSHGNVCDDCSTISMRASVTNYICPICGEIIGKREK